jgi:protein farnesyltransferase/geranylgeranyltransferase type-1 subunit alpha
MEIYQKEFEEEREFLSEIFYSDGKNYHAWSYRLWFVERFGLMDAEEFEFVDEELKDQVTNNSLWSYRYFLLNKTREFSKELVAEEL